MDISLASALASLRSDLRRVESTLSGRLHQVEARLDGLELAMSAEIARNQAEIAGRIAAATTELRTELRRIGALLSSLDAVIASDPGDPGDVDWREYAESVHERSPD